MSFDQYCLHHTFKQYWRSKSYSRKFENILNSYLIILQKKYGVHICFVYVSTHYVKLFK